MTFIEAVKTGLITPEELVTAQEVLSQGGDNNGRLVHFENFDAETEPIFNKHNTAICALDELRGESARLFKQVKEYFPGD